MDTKPILFFDMDNVLVNFQSGIDATDKAVLDQYADDGQGKPHNDDVPGIFSRMKPTDDAVEAVKKLNEHYDCYVLSTSPWGNPTALSDKLEWLKRYFDNTVPVVEIKPGETNCGNPFYKKVIFSHHKDLCLQPGAWLIDDREKNGAAAFGDHLIQFGSPRFPDWKSVRDYLLSI